MENQANNKYSLALDQQRVEIDKIDEEILQLLNKRMQIVANVKKIKDENGEKFFIKSAREADMIKDLIAKSNENIPNSTIVSIWRKIITSSNMHEQPLKVAIHNPQGLNDYKYLVREYYADFVPTISCNSVQKTILELENKSSQIAVFAEPKDNDEDENWWVNLANNQSGIKIFAKLPFFNNENGPNLYAAAIKEMEKSENDITLLSIELSDEKSQTQLERSLKECDFDFLIKKSAIVKNISGARFYFVEIKGFCSENDERLNLLKSSEIKPFVRILGVFANN